MLELGFLTISLASDEVEDIHEQPPAVTFRNEDGRNCTHTFDFLLVRRGGRRVAVDVKPLKKIEKSGIVTTQRLIKEQIGPAFADCYLIRTEEHIHPDDVFDARLVLRAHRLSDPAADAALRRLVRGLHGWCQVDKLVDATGLGAAGFNAVARLVGAGSLEIREQKRISLTSFVRRRAW